MSQRNFSRRRHMNALSEINVTPLLDMCFCLLIIFMIATPVLEQTTNIDLPLASRTIATPTTPAPVKPVTISLDKQYNIVLDGRVVSEEVLREALKNFSALPSEQRPLIRFRGDNQVTYGSAVRILEIAREYGLNKIGLATEVRD